MVALQSPPSLETLKRLAFETALAMELALSSAESPQLFNSSVGEPNPIMSSHSGDVPSETEITLNMTRAGGRAVAAFMASEAKTSSHQWEPNLAEEVYRAMRSVEMDEQMLPS